MTMSAATQAPPEGRPGGFPPALLSLPAPDALSGTTRPSLACLLLHMTRLQAIQAMCESKASRPEFRLTLADVSLALSGLDWYFAPRFANRQITLREIQETLQWVRERFADEQFLEDVIQALWEPLLEAQYEARRAAKGGGRHGQQQL